MIATQKMSLAGTQVQLPARQPRSAASRVVKTQALFGRKSSAVAVEEPPAKSGGLFGGRSSRSIKQQQTIAKPTKQQKSSGKVDKAAEYNKRQSSIGRTLSAFDFAEVRSKSDAELLYDAKYGDLKDGKMTREQYRALRRRIGGTAKDYWKDWVDVQGKYVDKGYVAKDNSSTSSVPALPFLVGVVVALFGATAYVVAQTS